MHNPWRQLPSTDPFVFAPDRQAIDTFNRTASDEAYVHLELLPEPFLGRPDAPVILLNLNPGFSPHDIHQHENTRFVQMSRNNLNHVPIDYPFYLLDPQVGGPGYDWWKRKLKALLQQYDQQLVARSLLCVEYFPYHSRRFHHHKLRVPSQEYSFSLVRAAMQRNAVIVLMRSKWLWYGAIPELQQYPRFYKLKNPQNPAISPGNCPDGYFEVVKAISEYVQMT